MIRIDDFPQLKAIAWSCPGRVEIEEQDALALYERNWRHVEVSMLTEAERALINRLAAEHGGVLPHV